MSGYRILVDQKFDVKHLLKTKVGRGLAEKSDGPNNYVEEVKIKILLDNYRYYPYMAISISAIPPLCSMEEETTQRPRVTRLPHKKYLS